MESTSTDSPGVSPFEEVMPSVPLPEIPGPAKSARQSPGLRDDGASGTSRPERREQFVPAETANPLSRRSGVTLPRPLADRQGRSMLRRTRVEGPTPPTSAEVA